MIEPTDEMIAAFDRAVDEKLSYLHRPQAEVLRVGLAAVFALVERNYDVRQARCDDLDPNYQGYCERLRGHTGQHEAEVTKVVRW